MIKSHKIRIYPNKEQTELLIKSCGVARFTYNWGLAKWKEEYENGNKPNLFSIKKLFNAEKKNNPELSWLYDVTKCSPEYALMNLNQAFQRLFKTGKGYPRFKKKRYGVGSFSVANDKFSIGSNYCKLPRIGKIKMSESLRFYGKIMKGTASSFAGKWFLSISVEIPDEIKNENGKSVGIDLGLKTQIVTSDNEHFNQPDLIKEIKKIKKEQRILSRKQKRSKNKLKQIIKLQQAWFTYNNKKQDWIEKVTTYLSSSYQYICLENLNITGMMKNRKLSAKFQQVGLYRLVERMKTKSTVFQVNRFFPSSKLCSGCGQIKDDLKLSNRVYKCDCGLELDRDYNASLNILRQALSEFTSVDKEALVL